MQIWKFPIDITTEQSIDMPKDSKIISVQFQNNILCLWAMVNTEYSYRTKSKEIRIYDTGHEFEYTTNHRYIGTVQQKSLVWHIFEII